MASLDSSSGGSISPATLLNATKRFGVVSELSSYTGSIITATVDGFAYPFKYYGTSTDTVDGLYCLYGKGGTNSAPGRWINTAPIVNALEYGVIPGTSDSGNAMNSWLNAKGFGTFGRTSFYLPAGSYTTTIPITRTNKGACSIIGDGSGITSINFSADTNGISISNDTYPTNTGSIVIRGIKINSTGAKTSDNKEALYIRNSHLQRPGVILEDITVHCKTVGQEWAAGIHLFDCSASSISKIDMEGATYTKIDGIKITKTNEQPSVEHNISFFNLRATKRGMVFISEGTAGLLEGIQLSFGSIVGCLNGVYATTQGGAPYIGFHGVHINSFGGEAVYLDGFQQLVWSASLFYVNKDNTTNVVPTRGVYINNCISCLGNFTIVTTNNTANAVEFAGSGAGANLQINHILSAAGTNTIKIASGYTGNFPDVKMRLWDNNTTWGTTQGLPVLSLSTTSFQAVSRRITGTDPGAGDVPVFDITTGQFKTVTQSAVRAIKFSPLATGSMTADFSQYDAFIFHTGATDATVTIDVTKLFDTQVFIISVYDQTDTGVYTIQTSNSAINKVQDESKALQTSLILPITAGKKQMTFTFQFGHCIFLGY